MPKLDPKVIKKQELNSMFRIAWAYGRARSFNDLPHDAAMKRAYEDYTAEHVGDKANSWSPGERRRMVKEQIFDSQIPWGELKDRYFDSLNTEQGRSDIQSEVLRQVHRDVFNEAETEWMNGNHDARYEPYITDSVKLNYDSIYGVEDEPEDDG